MIFLLFSLMCLIISGISKCDNIFGSKNDELFLGREDGERMNKFASLLLAEEVSLETEAYRKELFTMFISSFQVCQNSIDEAAQKMNLILDVRIPDMLNDDFEFDDEFNEENIMDSADEGILDVSFQDEKEDLSDVFEAMEEANLRQQRYVLDLERILRVFKHACTSLPKYLPKLQNRKPRSPQNIAKSVVQSLKKWSEHWLNSIELKISVFMTHCINDVDCKAYLEKVIRTFSIELENQDLGMFSPALSEILDELSVKNFSLVDSLSKLHRTVFGMENSVDGLIAHKESSFQMAAKISLPGNENRFLLTSDKILKKEFGIYSKLFMLEEQRKGSVPELEIETSEVVRSVPTTFLSVAFGSSLIQEKFSSVKAGLPTFLEIASGLSPAFLRVGGSAANFLTYDPSNYESDYEELQYINKAIDSIRKTTQNINHPKLRNHIKTYDEDQLVIKSLLPASSVHPKGRLNQYRVGARQSDSFYYLDDDISNRDRCDPQLEKHFVNFTMTGNDWKFLVDLSYSLNWTLLFDLNQFRRNSDGKWDPSNAILLLKDPLSTKIPIVWQLGNEPNAYQHKFNWKISPEQNADDYKILRQELTRIFRNAFAVGPDVTRPKHTLSSDKHLTEDSMQFLKRFLESGSQDIDAVTWHQYYMDGHSATLKNFISPEMLNLFPKQLEEISSVRDSYSKGKPIWLTETASAWGGGAPGLSNKFAAGFSWLDKLGAAALGGVDMVFRQTLYGGCYSLLDKNLNPFPDYWISYLHKHLVGKGVLLPRTRLAPKSIRIYAHCLNSNHFMFKKGAIVVFGMNLLDETKHINFYENNFRNDPKFIYKLTPPEGNLISSDILVNGNILQLKDGSNLPVIEPVKDDNEDLTFSPWSMNFWIFPDAEAAAC